MAEKWIKRGLHAGKVSCAGCGRFIIWLPQSRDAAQAPPELLEQAKQIKRPVARLRGESDEQVARAAAARIEMFNAARRRRDLDRAMVLSVVTDAAWFCVNARKRYGAITWPSLAQLAPPDDPAGSVTVVGPQGDLCNLLQRLGVAEERPVETGWFAVLDGLQIEQGRADEPRQLGLEAAPMSGFNGSD